MKSGRQIVAPGACAGARRRVLARLASLAAVGVSAAPGAALFAAPSSAATASPAQPAAAAGAGARPLVEVWKSPTCGCCKDWIAHMRAEGFEVRANDSGNTAARARLGMPEKFGSCHTAVVAGYVVEGHVPAQDVRRLIASRPAAVGLAVPGMPVGSPGMDGPEYHGRKDPYDVLLVRRDGAASVFRSIR